MSKNLKNKCLSIALSILTIVVTGTSSFAHNAIYYDFLLGDSFYYDVIARDDMQSSSEAGHMEWAPEIGGYFYEAGNTVNRPLFVFSEDSLTSKTTPKEDVSYRHPGNIFDTSAQGDRVKYYELYTKHKGNGGLSMIGKAHTFPPTNASSTETKKILHLTTSSSELKELTSRLNRMMYSFNQLLYYAAPGENPGEYSGYETDFMATAEVLADAISHADIVTNSRYDSNKKTIIIPIPVDENNYNSVTIKIIGRTYDWKVVRYDGSAFEMKGAIRTVHSGFKYRNKEGVKLNVGEFYFADTLYKPTNEQENSKLNLFKFIYNYYASGKATSDQFYEFLADIKLSNVIVTANTKKAVHGTSVKNAYSTRDESILGRELTKAITGLIDSLTTLLKMQDYSELIFNTGVRSPKSYVIKGDGSWTYTGDDMETGTLEYQQNDPYFLGIYRLSWQDMVVKFNSVFLVFALMVIAFSLVKLLLHAQTIVISPHFRNEAYRSVLNYIIVAILLPLTWVIFTLLGQANYYITTLFGSSVNNASIIQMGVSGASGTLGSIAIGVCYFTALVYFNVVYVTRSINIAILMALSPLIISTLTLGGKYRNTFNTWLKELVANIFLQSFHAFILTFIVTAQSKSSGLESVVLVLGMIPLTSMFRGMFLGGNSISTGEQLGTKARTMANMGLATTALAGVRLAGAGLGGLAGIGEKGLNYLNNNLDTSNMSDAKAMAVHRTLGNISNVAKGIKNNAKPTAEALGKIAVGGAMSLATEGQSLQTALSGIETLASNTIDGASKKIGDAITNTKESALNKKNVMGESGKYMKSTKDKIISGYDLSKKDKETLDNIMSSSATDSEKQQAARAFLKSKGLKVSDVSEISYNEATKAVEIAEPNVHGFRIATVDDNLVISGGPNALSNPSPLPGLEVAATKEDESSKPKYNGDDNRNRNKIKMLPNTEKNDNVKTLNSNIENNGNHHVSYNKNGETSQYRDAKPGLVVDTVKSYVEDRPNQTINPDGSLNVSKSGNLVNVTKIDVSPDTITTYQKMDKAFETKMLNEMSKYETDDEKIAVRNKMIKEEYGENASFSNNHNTFGQIVTREDNNTNIVSAHIDNGGSIIFKTQDSAKFEYNPQMEKTRTLTAHTSSNVIYNALENTTTSTAPQTISVDTNVFGNTEKLDFANSAVVDNKLLIPVNEKVNEDLSNYYSNIKNDYIGKPDELNKAMSDYAFNKHQIQHLDRNPNSTQFVVNTGEMNCNYNNTNYSYDFKGYDEDSKRIIYTNNNVSPNNNTPSPTYNTGSYNSDRPISVFNQPNANNQPISNQQSNNNYTTPIVNTPIMNQPIVNQLNNNTNISPSVFNQPIETNQQNNNSYINTPSYSNDRPISVFNQPNANNQPISNQQSNNNYTTPIVNTPIMNQPIVNQSNNNTNISPSVFNQPIETNQQNNIETKFRPNPLESRNNNNNDNLQESNKFLDKDNRK